MTTPPDPATVLADIIKYLSAEIRQGRVPTEHGRLLARAYDELDGAAKALAQQTARVKALVAYLQKRGHDMTCPQATGPYDLDIYMEPSCTCGYDAALQDVEEEP